MSYDTDHPPLPAGYNSWDVNGDGMDGSGVNEPIWPVAFDSFQAMTPLVITDAMLDVFEKTCPDYVVPCQHNTVTFPRGPRELKLKEVA